VLPARQPHRKCRSLARFACHRHVATHHARELAGDGKAKPRPAVATRGQGIGLGEILKQFRLLFGGQADAGIRNRKFDPFASVRHLAHPQRERIDAMKIRHHGDFHLGQMLIVKDDISIIDFEGEPHRSIEDRRRKAAAARDVAGLIRSIDYSATAALERALKSAPDEHGKLARALESWREHSVAAFLSAYRSSLPDARLWPQTLEAADRLLDFFLLEKVFYEIEYELAHRPDWLRVPLAGTWRILSRSQGTPQ
jgi:hypothetical protein